MGMRKGAKRERQMRGNPVRMMGLWKERKRERWRVFVTSEGGKIRDAVMGCCHLM